MNESRGLGASPGSSKKVPPDETTRAAADWLRWKLGWPLLVVAGDGGAGPVAGLGATELDRPVFRRGASGCRLVLGPSERV